MVEQDGLKFGFESWSYKAPHVLIAAKSMSKKHCFLAHSFDVNVISSCCGHISPDARYPILSGRFVQRH
jgi:hypothetical protein